MCDAYCQWWFLFPRFALNSSSQDSRLCKYLVREIKVWLKINRITVHNNTYIKLLKHIFFILSVSEPGYYCTLESNSSTPTDGMTGNICPVGHYCTIGSSTPAPCDLGTYLDVTQQDDPSDCKLCTPGQYCAGAGLDWPTGNCSAGYYCPGGQNTSTPSQYKWVFCTAVTASEFLCLFGGNNCSAQCFFHGVRSGPTQPFAIHPPHPNWLVFFGCLLLPSWQSLHPSTVLVHSHCYMVTYNNNRFRAPFLWWTLRVYVCYPS